MVKWKQIEPCGKTIYFSFDPTVSDTLEIGRRYQTHGVGHLHEHTHDPSRLEIVFLRKGCQTYLVENSPYRLIGGSVLVIRPGERHGGGSAPQENGLMYWMAFNIKRPGATFLDLPRTQAKALIKAILDIPQRSFACHHLYKHFEAVFNLHPDDRMDPLKAIRVRQKILDILLDVIASSTSAASPSSDWSRRILEHIGQHLTDPLHIADMARHMGQSNTRFQALFIKEIGLTPKEYILRQRVESGKQLLRTTKSTITQLAFDLGFASSQHFEVTFRRYTGLTPGAYRSRRLGPHSI